jgi:membrane-associated phospholipid phosphatase
MGSLIRALSLRFAPQLAFIQARLTPGGKLGLELTLGALVMIGASWLFGGIAEDVVHGDPLTLLDVQIARWFHEHATPQVTKVMLIITHAHDPGVVVAAVLLLGGWLAFKRNWYWLIRLVLAVPMGMLLNVLMKFSFQRVRPSFDDPLLVVTTYSFPSGHVAGATLFYGVLAAMLVVRIQGWGARASVVCAAVLMVLLVALTRVYLGVHYLSDVMAAFAEGVAWLAICFTALNTLRKH